MTDRLVEILFAITGVLLTPVLIILVILFATTLWMVGGLAREWVDRLRNRRAWRIFLESLKTAEEESCRFQNLALDGYPAVFRDRIWQAKTAGLPSEDRMRKTLDDLELGMARRLSWLSFLTRVGPMLGLVGTLLPLGPALRGLASDDLASLASNLEVAFTSTVFGLLIGGLAYGASCIRRNWYDQDISDLEFLASSIGLGTSNALPLAGPSPIGDSPTTPETIDA
ncbi:MAG: biopolymer transporter [Planctomycetes bacterium SCN 63-9]|nr:MAG: biopolymer transporter [Planctomycetes bacterium SCN 63-9]